MNTQQIAILKIKEIDKKVIECLNEIGADLVPCNKDYYFYEIETIVNFLEEATEEMKDEDIEINYKEIKNIVDNCISNNISMLLLK